MIPNATYYITESQEQPLGIRGYINIAYIEPLVELNRARGGEGEIGKIELITQEATQKPSANGTV